MHAMIEHGSSGEGHVTEGSPWPALEVDFEQERVLAAARRGLFDEIPTMPTRIGRYRIDRRVGAGGMGEVYLGFDTELRRSVALKLVLPHLSAVHGPERLRREACALARLSHPNVVQVYEVGEHQGQTFLAMELVEGGTLADWLAGGKRSWQEILERFVAAARGLAAAHAAGIVHRDFKPENVSISAEGRPCVTDFGLASAMEAVDVVLATTSDELAEPPPTERLTTTGAVMGTVRYMPLEQLRGGPVDARADQFAFCVALYDALWGVSPFPTESVDTRRLALETTTGTPPPRGRAPRELWWVIRRGLSREPGLRWPDMEALVAALEAVPRRRYRLALGALLLVVGYPLGAAAFAPTEVGPRRDPCHEIVEELTDDWSDERQRKLVDTFRSTGLPFADETEKITVAALDAWRTQWRNEVLVLCQTTMEQPLLYERTSVRSACLEQQRQSLEATVGALVTTDPLVLERAQVLVGALPEPRVCRDEQGLLSDVKAPSKAQKERAESVRQSLADSRVQGWIG
jgi:serine/threonine protein kinase